MGSKKSNFFLINLEVCSNTYFLQVSAHVSLKVATKGYFRGKKNSETLDIWLVFLKEKRRSAIKKIEVSLTNLALLSLAQQHILWKQVHVFHFKSPPKHVLEVKKLWKFRFWGCFSIAKTEECDQRNWSFSEMFGITRWTGVTNQQAEMTKAA